jgi:hypothetical protein
VLTAVSGSVTSATESVNDRLADLVKRAERSALAPSTNKRNKVLLGEMSFALVALAQLVARLQSELTEKPRIVIP